MNRPIRKKSPLITLISALSIIALVAVVACTSDSSEETPTEEPEVKVSSGDHECPELVKQPGTGEEPLGPPPALPNIFTGTAYVDGEPVPEGELVYVKLSTSRSWEVEVLENGQFRDIIHGPVSDLDREVPFVFCLGNPDGVSVKAAETFEFKNEPFLQRDVELNFPMLPSDLP